jgi:hypothetical protein
MSAILPKADIRPDGQDVRFVPKADILHRSNFSLFDHLIGAE